VEEKNKAFKDPKSINALQLAKKFIDAIIK
jgi:hypothetical protein